jgi:hypothetical protein
VDSFRLAFFLFPHQGYYLAKTPANANNSGGTFWWLVIASFLAYTLAQITHIDMLSESMVERRTEYYAETILTLLPH